MTQTSPIPLVAPRPGYAANISALTLNHPSPVGTPVGRLHGDMLDRGSPAITVPQTPHPLQPPITPIAPVFARPNKASAVKFAPDQPIMRGDKEETLLPKRGEHGEQFWRRFSLIAKVDNNSPRFVRFSSFIPTYSHRRLQHLVDEDKRRAKSVQPLGVVVDHIFGFGADRELPSRHHRSLI
jgi:hypothetical protein